MRVPTDKMGFCLTVLFAAVFTVCFAANASADTFSATINAQGEALGGVSEYDVVIGVGVSASTEDAPPAPPDYSVKMAVYAPEFAGGALLTDIRLDGELTYMWILEVNPHGNIAPPPDRSSTLSWTPAEFADGDYEMRSGYEGDGSVVIADMTSTTEYVVTGGDSNQYFTIHYTPPPVIPSTVTVRNTGGPTYVYDENGVGDTLLAEGALVEIIKITVGSESHRPSADGETTGGDAVAFTSTVGAGPFSDGQLYRSGVGIPTGTIIYVRVWNAASISAATHYGDSATHTMLVGGETTPYVWEVPNFATASLKPAPPTGVTVSVSDAEATPYAAASGYTNDPTVAVNISAVTSASDVQWYLSDSTDDTYTVVSALGDGSWTSAGSGVTTAPTSFTFTTATAESETLTLYAWAKNEDGVSASPGTASIILDTTDPSVAGALTAPDGTEIYLASTDRSITWTTGNVTDANLIASPINLAYSTDGGSTYANEIATGQDNSGTHAWSLPAITNTLVRVRIEAVDEAGNSGQDASAADFEIYVPVGTTLSTVSGDGQSDTVGNTLANSFVVQVVDQHGLEFAGQTVTFAVTGGGGSITPTTMATDAGGLASTTLTLGTTAGANTATASADVTEGTPQTFTATGVADAAAQIRLAASATSFITNGTDTIDITATVEDQHGNTVTDYATDIVFSVTPENLAAFAGVAAYTVTAANITDGVAVATLRALAVDADGTVQVSAVSDQLSSYDPDTPANSYIALEAINKVLNNIEISVVAGGMVQTASPKDGETVQLMATAHYNIPGEDIDPELDEDVTTTAAWNSSDETKGTVGANTGFFTAIAEGATNVTATFEGMTSAAFAMDVQEPDPVVIDTTDLPTAIMAAESIDFGAATSGGTGVGITYAIDSQPGGNPGMITTDGVFSVDTTMAYAGIYVIRATDDASEASTSYAIAIHFVIAPETMSITELTYTGASNPQPFTVTGSDATSYTWEILDAASAQDEVATPGDYGTWTAGPTADDNTNTFNPADVSALMVFYVRVTVVGDDDLTAGNGLNQEVVGPFTVVPLDTFTVSLEDATGAIDGSALQAGDITVTETLTEQTKNLTAADGTVTFLLPDVSNTFDYEVDDTRTPPVYASTDASSALKDVTIVLELLGEETISGTVEDALGAALQGANVVAKSADLEVKYEAMTDAAGAYTITLPAGVLPGDLIVVASLEGYASGRKAGQATVGFTLTQKTAVSVTAEAVNDTVRIDIVAAPAFTDVAEATRTVLDGTGALGAATLANGTISVVYDALEDFTIQIVANTSGALATVDFSYDYTAQAMGQIDVDAGGGEVNLQLAGKQPAAVAVPSGGLKKNAVIVIKQVPKVNTASAATRGSLTYVYDVTGTDDTGADLTDEDVDRVEIRAPIDLSIVQPGDLENGVYFIYYAADLATLEAGGGTAVPVDQILSTDYSGDGEVGSVLFWIDHLTVIGVGVANYDLATAVTGNGATSPAEGSNTYAYGTVVTITATPDTCWQFDSWTGDVADSNAATTTVTMDEAQNVTANFSIIEYGLTMSVEGNGETSPAEGSHTYNCGSVVEITATPDPEWEFVNWEGDVANANSATTTVTMDAGKTVAANYIIGIALIDLSSEGNCFVGSAMPGTSEGNGSGVRHKGAVLAGLVVLALLLAAGGRRLRKVMSVLVVVLASSFLIASAADAGSIDWVLDGITIETAPGGTAKTTAPNAGQTVQLKAIGHYRTADLQRGVRYQLDFTRLATWRSWNTSSGTVGANTGLFKAVADGRVKVTAAFEGVTSQAIFMNVGDPVGAARGKWYLDFNGLYALEGIDDDQTLAKFRGPMTVDFDSSWGVRVGGGHIINDIYSIDASLEYIVPFEDTAGGKTDDMDVKNLSLGAKLALPKQDELVPYGILGIGIMNSHEDITYKTASSRQSDWGMSLRVGAGLDYYVGNNISIGAEAAYVTGMGDVDHVKYTTISVGLQYHLQAIPWLE